MNNINKNIQGKYFADVISFDIMLLMKNDFFSIL